MNVYEVYTQKVIDDKASKASGLFLITISKFFLSKLRPFQLVTITDIFILFADNTH